MDWGNATIGSLVWHLSIRWRTEVDRLVAPFGLTHAQYSTLASLHAMTEQGTRPTQRELSEFMGLTPIYVSKLIRTLESAGNLLRKPDPHDSRAVRLELSNEGREKIVTARNAVKELDRKLTEPLGAPDDPAARAFANTLKSLIHFHEQMGDTKWQFPNL